MQNMVYSIWLTQKAKIEYDKQKKESTLGEYVGIFDKEFLERTKKIIKHSDLLRYNVTLVLNCTLALICLPIERSNEDYQNKTVVYDKLFASLYEKLVQLNVNITETQKNTPPKQMLKCLRNGIAHVKMTAVNETGKISGVTIIGGTKYQDIVYNCTFEFTKKQLKEFALYMADEYLKM